MKSSLALTLVCTGALALSQATLFPLEHLTVRGNTRISTEKIVALTGFKIGSPVQKEDFDAARARLLTTGAFESVGYEFKPSASNKGYDGFFDVVEVDQLFSYRFENLPVPDDALRAGLRAQEPLLDDKIPARPEVMDRYAKAIEQIAESSGVGKIAVMGKTTNDVPGQLTIVFRPPTQRSNIAEVNFTGNQVLPFTLLVNALSGVAIGVPYNDVTIRLLVESSIRPLYDARGRIRVSFPSITSEKSTKPDVEGVVVTVTVNEGTAYSLGAVKFAGISTSDANEVQRAANFQPNDVANFDDINAGLDRVYKRYKGKGYLHATGKTERKIDDEKHTVDLLVTVDPGPLYSMGKLEIKGLDVTSEPAIRKVWMVKTGEPFQPDYPDSFLNDLRAQEVFDNLGKTEAEMKIDEKAKTVDVTLHFSGSARDAQQRKRREPGIRP